MPKRKKCRECGRIRLIKFFSKNCQAKDGIRIYCKDCQRSGHKKYYTENKDSVLTRTKKYKDENKEYCNQYAEDYRKTNRKELRAKYRKYYEKNRDKVLQSMKEWSQNNKDVRASIDHRYRAKKLNQMGVVSPDIVEILLEAQNGKCYYCCALLQETGYHQEHKIPISRGGLHADENLCLSCPPCNFKKGCKTEEEFCSLGGV